MSDGKEYFKAGINLDQFDKDVVHINGRFTDIGKAAEIEGARIDKSLKQVGITVAGIFTLQKAKEFATEIASVRGQFQQLEIAFETMLGSKEKSDALMRQLVDTAAKTPFDLAGVSNGAKMLLAYGTASEVVNEKLIRLGDIASGLNIPLGDLVTTYGKIQTQGRMFNYDVQMLLGKGIPIVRELAKEMGIAESEVSSLVASGKIGFKELDKVISNLTSEGGMFYNLMAKQSASLTGQIANLGDAYDVMLNEIGTNSQDAFGTAINLTTLLVENYEIVGKALGALIVTYGSYKTAIIALNFVQSLQTKLALESALAGKRLSITQGIQALTTKSLSKAQMALNKSMLANPYALATMAVVGLGYATYKLVTYKTELQKVTDALNTTIFKEEEVLKNLVTRLNSTKKGTDEYNSAKKALNEKYGDSLKAINMEVDALYRNKENYKLLTDEIEKNAKARLKNKYIDQFSEKNAENVAESYRKIYEKVRSKIKGIDAGEAFADIKDFIDSADVTTSYKLFDEVFKKHELKWSDFSKDVYSLLSSQYNLKNDLKELDLIFGEKKISTESDIDVEKNIAPVANLAKQTEEARKEVEKLKKELADLMSGKTASENYYKDIDEKAKELKLAEEKLNMILYGKTSIDGNKGDSDNTARLENNRRKAALDARAFELDNESKRIALMKDGFEKEQKLIENNHQKELLAIQRRAQELIEQQQQAEKDLWEKNGSKGTFKATTVTIQDLPNNHQSELVEAENIANNQRIHSLEEVNTKLLARYQDYTARKLDIEERFDEDLKALNAISDSDAKNAAIAQLEKDRKAAIKSISEEESAELVASTDLFVRLFTEASQQSVRQIKNVISETQDLYDYLTKTKSEDISDNFGFTAEQLRTFKGDATQLKAVLDGLIGKKKDLGDRSPFESFKQGMSDGLKKIKSNDANGLNAGVSQIGKSVQDFLPSVKEFGESFSSMFDGPTAEAIDGAMKALDTIGGIAEGFANGGIVGGISAVANEGMKLFAASKAVDREHREAVKRLENERIAQQRQYNLLLIEQNMLLKESSSIFGGEEIRKATNYVDVYRDTLRKLHKEIKGDKPTLRKSSYLPFQFMLQKQYDKDLAKYNKGILGISQAEIVDGSRKSGWGPWKKRKDVYKSVLDVYPDLINAEGDLDKAMLESILSTRKMSDETRAYLENLKDLTDAAEKAKEELKNYLASTFGELGTGAIKSIVDSIKEGTNAWVEFGKVGSSVIEKLGEQLAYELFFADKFKKLQSDLEKTYGSGKSSETIAKEAMDLVGDFYQNIGSNMDMAQDWMLNWKDEAKKVGFDLWEGGNVNQDSSRGYSTTMTQDQAGEGLGRLTSIHINILDVSDKVGNIVALDIERNNLLRGFVVRFDELRDLSLQIVFRLDDIIKDTKYLPIINDNIEDLRREIRSL